MIYHKLWTRILLLVIFTGLALADLSYLDFPAECYSAKTLDDESRLFENFETPTSKANDLNLKGDWYRVLGKAGNSLKQGFPRPLRPGDTPPYFCGTKQPGTLMGEHPTIEEGLVTLTVCFRSAFCFVNNVKECECSHTQTVYVRNCNNNHFIYWLMPTSSNQRYCTGKTSMTGPKITNGLSQALECFQHKEIESPSRIWNRVGDVSCDDQLYGWYRFRREAGSEIASTCSVSKNQVSRLGQPCGAGFRGWMVDSHPKVSDGRVDRRVCFSYAQECVCEFFSLISVRNCGNYYVYRLSGTPVCKARYCGAFNNSRAKDNDISKPAVIKHTDLCKANYQVMHDPDRLWSFTSPTVKKCDSQFYGIFRFGSQYTPWSIREGCNKSEMAIVTHRCGADFQGYMLGKHPLQKEGLVERVVCFQSPSSPCECQYTSTVGVQNCGKFYVYSFRSVPVCSARFCMVANKSTSITIDPGRSPLYEIPAPGYTPEVAKQTKEKDDDDGGLVATTTVLSIIVFIIIILLILVIILLIFVAWPIYKERRRRVNRHISVEYPVEDEYPTETKPSTSNGNLPKQEEEMEGEYEEAPMPRYPSEIPPKPTSKPPTASDDDSVVDMQRGPASDDDLNTIPEDTEHSDEYDTLLKKEDVKKPQAYDHKDSAV